MNRDIIGRREEHTQNFTWERKDGKIRYRYRCNATGVFGLGERFCSVNHLGRRLINRVFEKFTRQHEDTYLPIPFYLAEDGHGVFVDTANEVVFDFTPGEFCIELAEEASHKIYFYYGSPKEIIGKFVRQTGAISLPPKWSFGIWASANRWNTQEEVERQLAIIEEHQYPVSVMVLEAWSDEATFYIWNGAQYAAKDPKLGLAKEEFTFGAPWPDPMAMINKMHEKGIKLILWQIPALKELEEGRICSQHDADCLYAVENDLVAKKEDGTPYYIPKQWFIGSLLPDFSNPETRAWWFQKRDYLLEMGVDGFKTDGGEFVHDPNTCFYQGVDGKSARNLYAAWYEKAYMEFIGKDRILFSRAGYTGAQTTPMHWAGDQLSDFSELQSVFRAGISLSFSGVPFWSFDIGGFAGPLPDKELYLRASALAAFVSAMQWHSEPAEGQFEEVLKGNGGNNDRSPWNMADVTKDTTVMEIACFFARLHMNMLPHIYSEAIQTSQTGIPLMKHLYLEYYQDEEAKHIENEYMIGDLLIAPVLEPGCAVREVYLPQGTWYDFWTGECYGGGCYITADAPLDKIPLYLREGGAIALNLGAAPILGNTTVPLYEEGYENIYILYEGNQTTYEWKDQTGTVFYIEEGKIIKTREGIHLLRVKDLL